MDAQKTIEAVNGIDLETLRSTIETVRHDPEMGKCRFRASNRWIGGNHNCTTVTGFYCARQDIAHRQPFELHADEPALLAGEDQHANPVEYLLKALAACVTTSMVAHAATRGIHIDELESEIEGDLDMNGYLGLSDDVPKGYTNIRVRFKVKTDEENLEKLKSLAEFSPVYNTIINGANVDIEVESK
jgi:uncharacterized OsmC-like protein